MSMRALIRQQIIARPALTAADGIPAERWYGSGAVDQNGRRPFAELRLGSATTGMGAIKRRRLDIYVHDVEGDYGRIDSIISDLYDLLHGLEQVNYESAQLMRSEWTGDSVDLFDDGYKTIYRSTGYDLVGKE